MARFGNFDQYLGNDGNPLVSGRLYFFETGTTTPKTTYADINNSIANTNPVILTASGRQPNVFFEGVAKAILTDSADVQIAVQDPVGETGTDFGNEWIATRIYSALDVVRGSDGIYYRSLVNANQNNNPVNTSGSWALLYSVQWNAGITYAVGALVTYDNLQYQSLQGTNLNQNPSTAGSYWVSLQFAWLSTITYSIHQNVIGTDGVLYTSLQNSNTNQVPASSAAWWVGSSAAAASSASAAATSATAAETAETNAETAETNAETAETAAVAAKDLAAQQATLAEAAAAAADATANAELWVSAGSYTAGQNRYSPINYLTYRAITTHSGVSTDPSLDATNWVAVFGASLSSNTFTGTQDFTGATVLGIDSDPILGFANKSSWADGEQISIALDPSASAIAKAHVSVYEEIPQTDVTNSIWDVITNDLGFTLVDSAYSVTLTPAATTGGSIEFTLGSGSWASTDLGKVIKNKSAGESGEARVISVASGVATCLITVTFTNTDAIASGDWEMYSGEFTSGSFELSNATTESLTAGTPLVFESASTTYISVTMLTSTKAIVAYRDNGNSTYGTACILDVSGSTITAGTPAVFESATIAYTSVTMLTSTKAIVTYQDAGNSSYGTSAIIDTESSLYVTDQHVSAISGADTVDTTFYTDLNSVTATETLNSQTANYVFSFNPTLTSDVVTGGSFIVIGNGETATRTIASSLASVHGGADGTWYYNSNATYASETWASSTINTTAGAVEQAQTVAANNMSGTDVGNVADGNWPAFGTKFALGIVLKSTSTSATPSVDKVLFDYDGNVLNQISYEYEIDMPTTSVVRVTAPSTGGPRNARVYVSK